MDGKMAEGVGFEPTRRAVPSAGFQDRCLKPLGHPSNAVKSAIPAVKLKDEQRTVTSMALLGPKGIYRRMPFDSMPIISAALASAFIALGVAAEHRRRIMAALWLAYAPPSLDL